MAGGRLLRAAPALALISFTLLVAPRAAAADLGHIQQHLLPGDLAGVDDFAELHIVFPQDPQSTWFEDTFGYVKPGGRRHMGVDLMAPKRTPVFAIADGVVTAVRRSPRAGYYIRIEHRGGWSSWYMHLNNDSPGTDDGRAPVEAGAVVPGVAEGVFVVAGQLIGYVGDSGNAEGTMPHTHFELHAGGRAVDPFPYLLEAHQRALLQLEATRRAQLLQSVDDQLRDAMSSSSATLAATASMAPADATVALSGVEVEGASPSTTQMDR